MPAYAWVNRVLNMPEFSMSLMQYKHKVPVQIMEQLSRQRRIQNTIKHFKWSLL